MNEIDKLWNDVGKGIDKLKAENDRLVKRNKKLDSIITWLIDGHNKAMEEEYDKALSDKPEE